MTTAPFDLFALATELAGVAQELKGEGRGRLALRALAAAGQVAQIGEDLAAELDQAEGGAS